MQGDTRGWSTGKYGRLDEGVGMRVLAPATVAGSYSSHGRSADETGHVLVGMNLSKWDAYVITR